MELGSIQLVISTGMLLTVFSLNKSEEYILNHSKGTGNYILQAHLSMVYFCHFGINKSSRDAGSCIYLLSWEENLKWKDSTKDCKMERDCYEGNVLDFSLSLSL